MGSGNSSTSEVARPPVLTDKASYYRLDVVGPCMDFPCMSQTVILRWFSTDLKSTFPPKKTPPALHSVALQVRVNFFQHASKSMDARRKNLNCTKAT